MSILLHIRIASYNSLHGYMCYIHTCGKWPQFSVLSTLSSLLDAVNVSDLEELSDQDTDDAVGCAEWEKQSKQHHAIQDWGETISALITECETSM